MDCYFTYILPGSRLTPGDAQAIFLKENDVHTTLSYPITRSNIISQPKQHDAHVRAYRHWRRQDNGRLHQKAWQEEELALREQEEAWAIAQRQKRAHHETEIRRRKDNTPAKLTTVPTAASRKPHAVKMTISQQVAVDKEEWCEGPACGGQGK